MRCCRNAALICCIATATAAIAPASVATPSSACPARRSSLSLRGGGARAVLTEAKMDELRSQGPPLAPRHHDGADDMVAHAVPEGEMSVGTGILNLVADLCPHGMLPVAFGMAAAGGTGVLAAPALLAIFGATSAYTLISLGRASERTGQYSFSGLWANLIGRDTAWVIEVAFAVMTFGCCVFYSAFIGDLFSSLASSASWVPKVLKNRSVDLCALSVFPLLPLCLMKNLSALQPTSFGGLISIMYTVWFVAKRAFDGTYAPGGQFFDAIDVKYRNPLKDSWGSVGLWKVGPGTITLMNMACVAFMAHYNGVKYYEELEHRTVKRYTVGISTGVAICFCVFSAMMLLGFKTFGTASQTLLLNNYHRTEDSLAGLARLATGCAILCGYPLMFAALKTSGLNAAHEIARKFESTRSLAPRFLNDDGLRNACCVGVLSVITAIACNKSEEDVAVVVGLIGALLGGGANFVIPAILNLKLFAREPQQQRSAAQRFFSEASLNRLLIVCGAVFMVVGTASVLKDAQHGHH